MAATLLVSTFRYLAEARKVAVLVVHRRSALCFLGALVLQFRFHEQSSECSNK
jgi:hypothetical protein